MQGVSSKGDHQPRKYAIDEEASTGDDREETATKALDLLVDGELKLLAIYDARQASADTRTTALAAAAIALPPLILSLSKAFTSNSTLLHWGYLAVVILAILILIIRGWNAWRTRQPTKNQPRLKSQPKHKWLYVSADSAAVADAREKWRDYQVKTGVGKTDPVRVGQLALEMWRARADDSRKVAHIKERLSVLAGILLVFALVITAILVMNAHFK